MAEIRKQLTDVQKQQLAETQGTLSQLRAAFQKAEAEAQRVVALIFDAHGVPQDWTAEIDQETGDLVCKGPDAPAEAGLKLE
jgi:hypothetical protein